MKKSFLAVVGIVLVIVAIVAYASVFTVHQTNQALILQFGDPVRVVKEPGLKFKMPFVQNVEYYDRRILNLDPPPQEVPFWIRNASTSIPSLVTASSIRWSSRKEP